MELFVNLDEVLKKLNAKTKLDHKESSDGLWEVTESDLLEFIKQNAGSSLPYPIFCSPVGGYIYLLFVTDAFRLPICIRLENIDGFRLKMNEAYQKVVTNNATV
jgi:hypothetical protein